MKRFNEWPAAYRTARTLAEETGFRFRVRRSRLALYGWFWWEVTAEPAVPALVDPA